MYKACAVENKFRMSEDLRKYFAVYLDCDGSISPSYHHYEKKYQNKTVRGIKRKVVVASSTDFESMEELQNRLPYESVIHYNKPKKSNHRDMFLLEIHNDNEILEFLLEVQPYFLNKSIQCECMIRILRGIDIEHNIEMIQLANRREKNHFIHEETLSNFIKSRKKLATTTSIPDYKNIVSDPASIAASLDSDGSIQIGDKNSGYACTVMVNCSTKEHFIRNLEKKFLSDQYYNLYEIDNSKYNPNSSIIYRIIIPKKAHLALLRQALPFMVTRRRQAETMIEYLENKISAQTCYEILKDLNKRGAEGEVKNIIRNKKKTNININTKIEKLADTIQTVNILNVDNGYRSRRYNKKQLENPIYASLDQFGLN
jgi:hypothetical protein